MAIAIGIDLGTTNSCAAIMSAGKPRVITLSGETQVLRSSPSMRPATKSSARPPAIKPARTRRVPSSRPSVHRTKLPQQVHQRHASGLHLRDGGGADDSVLLNVAEQLYTSSKSPPS